MTLIDIKAIGWILGKRYDKKTITIELLSNLNFLINFNYIENQTIIDDYK
jgi:hypothetical protein